jgi:ell wall binding domain 2 (CWB2)
LRLPNFLQGASDWLRRDMKRTVDPRVLAGVGVVIAFVGLLWLFTAGPLGGDDEPEVETRLVTVAIESDDPAGAPVGPLGFPLVATRNTTRVGGPDAATDAAAIALATHPRTSAEDSIEAAILVGADDWQAGIAASVLAGPPMRAAVLVGEEDGLTDVTADALAKLNPQGGPGADDAAVYVVGDVAPPDGYASQRISGGSPAESANAIDQLRQRLLNSDPGHILVASSEQAPYAMPAAAWAARSGDPVLFTGRDELPEPTVEALDRHRGVPIYVLGPESVITDEVMRQIERASPGVQRIGEQGPTANSISFARYTDASFGWNINDPGHGLVLAAAGRPQDAGASAALSASGKWGPLLVVEDADTLSPDLRSFMLDIKPGFEDDPTRAVYNHVWLIGDASVLGARLQAEVDEVVELAEVGPGAGGPVTETGSSVPGPGVQDDEPEPEPQPGAGNP